MRIVITYGTYDLLHQGHLNLLRRARALGDYLIVGVTSDAYDRERGKLNVQQSTLERVDAVRQTGLADLVIIEEYEGQKIADIQRYNVDVFTVGSDWVGKYDYLEEYCQVVYLNRTEGISSTELRTEINKVVRIGVVGADHIANRFVREASYVSGVEVVGLWDESERELTHFDALEHLHSFTTLDELLASCDALSVFVAPEQRANIILRALESGKHVMSETPLFLRQADAQRAYACAQKSGLVLFESIKTLYFPAFEHLFLLAKSGQIGEIRDIDISCSQIPSGKEGTDEISRSALLEWGTDVLMPIVRLLGNNPAKVTVHSQRKGETAYFTRALFCYPQASATFSVGYGIKTEGDLVITGTKGYLYVPAPWWLTDYFEIRHEDLRLTRKYFWSYEGEGFRYEILAFLQEINGHGPNALSQSAEDVLAETRIIEQALTNEE